MFLTVGQHGNHLGRPNVTVTMSPLADTKFPALGLYDGTVAKYSQFRDLTANPKVIVDLCLVKNPGFESGLLGWKRFGNDVVADTSQFHGGAKSCRVPGSPNQVYQDVIGISGEQLRLNFWTRGHASGGSTAIALQDNLTGLWLQSDGTWGASIYLHGSNATEAFVEYSKTFTVQPFSSTLRHLTSLRISGRGAGSNGGWIDDITLVPATNWCSVHGVGITANLVPTLYSDDDSAFGSATLQATLTPQPLAFGASITSFLERYAKFQLTGTPKFKPWLGEFVLSQAREVTAPTAKYGSKLSHEFPVANAKANRLTALKTTVIPQRKLTLPFRYPTDATWELARELLVDRCRGEGETVIVGIDELDDGLVMMGGFQGPRGHAKIAPTVRDGFDVIILEDPFPRVPVPAPGPPTGAG